MLLLSLFVLENSQHIAYFVGSKQIKYLLSYKNKDLQIINEHSIGKQEKWI